MVSAEGGILTDAGKICHIWGLGSRKADHLRIVHKFKNGKSRCVDEHGRKCKLKYPRPNWIPKEGDGITCPVCYALDQLDKIEEQAQSNNEKAKV